LLLLLLIRPVFRSTNKRRQATLMWLRCCVILCAIMAMMRPTIVRTQTKPVATTLAVLVDASRSMQTIDVGERSRWAAAKALTEEISPALRALEETYSVKGFTFAKGIHEIAARDDDILFELPDSATGAETDIGAALDGIIRNQAGKRLGGILLISDGAQRSIAPRFDSGQLARQLARQGCPLYTVTLGKSRDRSDTRDIAIENFEDQYSVFAKNELVFRASVFSQGYVGQNIPVELEVTRPDGTTERIGPVTVTPTEDSESLDVRFAYTPPVAGQYELLLTATPQPGERITDNNSLGAFLQVLEGGLRVLYLCGNIGWQDHNFIRRSIDESHDIQLDFRWVDARRRRSWPINLRKLLRENDYDVFIFADVDAAAIGRTQSALIAKEIEEGKGFLMTGGAHSFGPGGYAETALADLLPIEMSRLERQEFSQRGDLTQRARKDVHLDGELTLKPTAVHFITRLSQGAGQGAIWNRLPPLHGANRFGKPKSTATVLLETSSHDPILVQGQYGLGRTLAFAGDSTYRWYRYGFQDEHKRFWRQVILWLARKDEDIKNDVWLRMDQRRHAAGSRVTFDLGVTDAEGSDIDEARFEVALVPPQGAPTKISVSKAKKSNKRAMWTGSTRPLVTPGTYTLRATAFRGNENLGSTEAPFIVLDQDIELADPTANPAQMEMLAEITADVGGKSLAAEQVEDLLAELRAKPIESTTEFESRWQLTDTAVDAWLLFLAIVGLLSFEWFLRKRWSMV
jgi:hypothetical protein